MISLIGRIGLSVMAALGLAIVAPQAAASPEPTQLVFLIVTLLAVLALMAMPVILRSREAQLMGTTWIAVFVTIVGGYSYQESITDTMRGWISSEPPAQIALARAIEPGLKSTIPPIETSVELARTRDGHFRAIVQIDDVSMEVMIDTGASIVMLPYEEAHRVGIDPAKLAFNRSASTANGGTYVAPVTFKNIRIGGVVLDEVPGAIAPPGALNHGLLGMSFLSRLTEVSMRGERLVLRQ